MIEKFFHQQMQMRVQEFMRSGYYVQASLAPRVEQGLLTLYPLQTSLCAITLDMLLLLVCARENSHSCFSYNLLNH